jgi:hypothetical protein
MPGARASPALPSARLGRRSSEVPKSVRLVSAHTGCRLPSFRLRYHSDQQTPEALGALMSIAAPRARRGGRQDAAPLLDGGLSDMRPEGSVHLARNARWEHKAVLETVQDRLDRNLEKMRVRPNCGAPVRDHRARMGATHFQMRRLSSGPAKWRCTC